MQAPVAVIGPQHFVSAFADCTCVAAPVRGPDGAVVGALDLTTSVADACPPNAALIVYAAKMIERDLELEHARLETAALHEQTATLAARELALQQTNERLQLIHDHAPVLIYVVSDSGRFLSANRAWLDQLGIESHQVIGRTLHDVFPQATADEFAQNNRNVLEAGVPVRYEEVHAGRTYLSVKAPVRDAAGNAYAICGMSIDITERKQADNALREQASVSAAITHNATTAVFVMDADGRTLFVNASAEAMTGFTSAEMQGRVLHDLIHHTRSDGRAYPMSECGIGQHVLARQPLRDHEDVFVRRDGTFFPVACAATPIVRDGRLTEIVLEVRDITERKQFERALQESARRKDEFLAVLAHELRNPLAPMVNALHLLSRNEQLSAAGRRATEILDRQVLQMRRVVDDLLQVGLIARGEVQLRLEPMRLDEAVRLAVDAAMPAFDAKRQSVAVSMDRAPVRITADPVRIGQVLENLLSNAGKYTPAGGRIWVELSEQASFVELSIADDGIGIERHQLDAVFELFARGDASGVGPGMGVGLALVRRLVELHGGTVTAESAGRDTGSRFTVRLPKR
ncbi:MAG TPA: PAS domain S-box protein, partial [Burkholderiaceae bacterium]|nr:PAS domain S-box protein [Burkholderiaceae bacterium]